jgi:tRNA (cmo5U34)-methyltransferase
VPNRAEPSAEPSRAEPSSAESNAAVWKSAAAVSEWAATAGERERRRGWPRQLMAELLGVADGRGFTFVDLGAGTGAAARAVLDRYPDAQAVLAEYSTQMMEEGRRALAAYEGRYRYVEVDLLSGPWPPGLSAADGVISSLCVHHLPDERKRGLFAEVLELLVPGGWYLNYDPVAAEEPAVQQAWRGVLDRLDPEAASKREHRSPEEQRRWENHIRHISPLAPQLEFLRQAGFEAVDVYWKELDHAVFGGRRPLS